jgi:hypothetical protein
MVTKGIGVNVRKRMECGEESKRISCTERKGSGNERNDIVDGM